MVKFDSIFLFIVFTLIVSGCKKKLGDEKSSPNVILIYADDLGRGLLSHEGQKIIQTPNIDKLAETGVRFESAYGGMFCSPARASLLTGYHDLHTDKWEISRAGLYSDITRDKYTREQVENAYDKQATPVPENEVFLPEVFKQAGYVTAQVGKLDWGFATTHKQLKRHGWDYYYGYYDHQRCHGFYPPFLFENGEMVMIEGNTRADCGKTAEWDKNGGYEDRWNMEGKKQYSQNLFLDKMIGFLRKNKDSSFFLYHPTQLPHGPSSIPEIHPDFKSNNELTEIEKTYASMVKMLDDHVGILVEELKTLGLYENTIIVFSGDNGHEIYYPSEDKINKPMLNMQTGKNFDNVHTKYYSELVGDVFNGNDGMAGMKRDNWEGAVRVPLIYNWPGKLEEGKTIHTKVANYDMMNTFADLLNVDLSNEKDGLSYLPELLGEKSGKVHDFIVYSSFQGPALVTQDGWKLRYYGPKDIYQLYYLPDDYREDMELSENHPEKLERLKIELIKACNGDIKNGWFSYQSGILETPNI
ncbi:sulfatase-like hydrolase/transferase [Urechidicola vernalis]|uniref:Sulfatase-like hydrolase/transferase n=1 Tax=Urechidicola vernalis TaxID=3075600 RepID=A0ABU2Y0Z6_9FLAO|nr:sulfatase-like hydrolase/transferase [Urechidicola sp. P050]MDT0551853.1 sulfatase-like hydrolase/transferase [Urechidicola sp. P050]